MIFSAQEHLIAGALLTLADGPVRGDGEHRIAQQLAHSAALIPGVLAASCSLTGPDGHVHDAASDDLAGELERLQATLNEGPCHDSLHTSKPLTDIPMDHPDSRRRWPRFSHRVLDAGFDAVTTLPIQATDRAVGTLNLYHRHHDLPPDGAHWAQVLAAATSVGLTHRDSLHKALRRGDQLQHALDSRVLIEQAKGMLAERLDCTSNDAFELLRHHARTHRHKVVDVAAQIVNNPPATGPFPRRCP
ncbi:GAF and ANTAR domain-containing protein [Streptomyces violascens]|uniref:GAF and ANTAR domain-containing protein n=1 Tax=Streptomyces violascens TaxID=67381 RepID=UPI0036D034D0